MSPEAREVLRRNSYAWAGTLTLLALSPNKIPFPPDGDGGDSHVIEPLILITFRSAEGNWLQN